MMPPASEKKSNTTASSIANIPLPSSQKMQLLHYKHTANAMTMHTRAPMRNYRALNDTIKPPSPSSGPTLPPTLPSTQSLFSDYSIPPITALPATPIGNLLPAPQSQRLPTTKPLPPTPSFSNPAPRLGRPPSIPKYTTCVVFAYIHRVPLITQEQTEKRFPGGCTLAQLRQQQQRMFHLLVSS